MSHKKEGKLLPFCLFEMAYFAEKPGLKTLFEIGSERRTAGENTLLLEIGKAHCYVAFLHKPSNSIEYVRLLSVDEFAMEEQLPELLSSLKENIFESTVICSAFPQALLFPKKYFNNDYSALQLVYDQPAQVYFHDNIPGWQMLNTYSLSKSLYNIVQELISPTQYYHTYTPTIKIYNGYVAENQLSIHFAETYFRVLLKKNANIHLVQTYDYKTPLDVVYYLLKICQEFQLSQQEVCLILSGLIEKTSNLFAELQQYFTQINFAQQPEIALPQSPHPHYYFTSLYNLAACVL